jgi:hypothetical protein
MREVDEIHIKNIKEKVKSDPRRNDQLKIQMAREKSMKNLSDVEREIDKTYKDLYGEEFYKK